MGKYADQQSDEDDENKCEKYYVIEKQRNDSE
jgi:hypothetical protein